VGFFCSCGLEKLPPTAPPVFFPRYDRFALFQGHPPYYPWEKVTFAFSREPRGGPRHVLRRSRPTVPPHGANPLSFFREMCWPLFPRRLRANILGHNWRTEVPSFPFPGGNNITSAFLALERGTSVANSPLFTPTRSERTSVSPPLPCPNSLWESGIFST